MLNYDARTVRQGLQEQVASALTRPIHRVSLLLQLRPSHKDLLLALRSRLQSGRLLHALRIMGAQAAPGRLHHW